MDLRTALGAKTVVACRICGEDNNICDPVSYVTYESNREYDYSPLWVELTFPCVHCNNTTTVEISLT